ncbi:cyclin-L1-1-like isoform X3 [Cucurbita pepo subsp. pepo]|uniref:cyclin-L1-1-like isoform X3 n=1 Tax=Cucurbita pepo subsp. pepo TaxID=3664 RepID=UPI000C9D8AF8|nr:cyclin-L1-1-like isoform X3 [Cucurbita pepo subsp. pepo]
MIYTAIDTFYLTDEQLTNSPSRKDGIDEATETSLRIYGCDLIQEAGILLKLPQAVMATGQVLFHRFYCKKSFARFNVKKYADLKTELSRTERHILKEMGFICHVEHPHKFISNYLATLGTPPELRQEAWNLANDSLRTTLCVRFKSEVVACGVVHAAARRFQVPLPENPPWWKAFDAEKLGIDEVCRVLAHLYTLPKAQYIPVCKDGDTFTFSNKSLDSQSLPVSKEVPRSSPTANDGASIAKAIAGTNPESGGSKDEMVKSSLHKLKESKKCDDDSKSVLLEATSREELVPKSKPDRRAENGEKNKERERDRDRERDRTKSRDRDRGRESDREREREDADREKVKDRAHRSKDRSKELGGHLEKSRHHSSRDLDYHGSSYSSRDKERHRHH